MDAHSHSHYPTSNGMNGMHMPRQSMSEYHSPIPNGAMPIHNAQGPPTVSPPMNTNGGHGHKQRLSTMSGAPFDFSRSPPSSKNTAHVPCKFYKVGNCQAGAACPFSHQDGAIIQPPPCKYFLKSNCKFGFKCANPHIRPNGQDERMFSQWRGPFGQGGGQLNSRNGIHNPPFPDTNMPGTYPLSTAPISPSLEYQNPSEGFYDFRTPSREPESMFVAGQQYPAVLEQHYGSPSASYMSGLSPPARAIDTKLPASFEHRIARIARLEPAGASVPSTFGLGGHASATSTFSAATPPAFSNHNLTVTSTTNGLRPFHLASSPPASSDDGFPRRILHSDLRSKPQMIMSASLPGQRPFGQNRRSEDSEGSEEELFRVPGALSDDLLTPSERARRFSRQEEEQSGFLTRQLSGYGSHSESKVGSPSNASPGSRYGALFRRQREDIQNADFLSASTGSQFGHVGSPLRKSSLQHETNGDAWASTAMSSRPLSKDGSQFGAPGSLPLSGLGTISGGVSALSQQIRGVKFGDHDNGDFSHSSSPQAASGVSGLIGQGRGAGKSGLGAALSAGTTTAAKGSLDRSFSGMSLGKPGTAQERIDEECLFSMEDETEESRKEKERREHEPDQLTNHTQPFEDIGASPPTQPQPLKAQELSRFGGIAMPWNVIAAKAKPSSAGTSTTKPAAAGAQQQGVR